MADLPNIVLITADELRADALSCYGNRTIETAGADRLADQGVKFERAYTVSPWCLPARASLVTGLYPHNSGASTNYLGWDGRLDADIPNLYTMLGEAGYTTAHVGKCHYAPVLFDERVEGETVEYEDYRRYYESLGMDRLILQDGTHPPTYFYDDYSRALQEETGLLAEYKEMMWDPEYMKVFDFPGPVEWHEDTWVGRKGEEVIAEHDGDDPLFAWISYSGPHYPFDPNREYVEQVDMSADEGRAFREDMYDDESRIHYPSYHGHDEIRRVDANGMIDATKEFDEGYWEDVRRYYWANTLQIDDTVEDIVTTAREHLGENTLVIFAADHGEMLGDHGLWGKHNCAYEPVWRVPLVMDHPDLDPDVVDEKVMLTDLTASILDAGGVDTESVDGEPLRDVIERGGREHVFAEGGGFAAISDGRHKYVNVKQGGELYYEQYDLEADPHEFDNLGNDPDAVYERSELREVLLNRFQDHSLPFVPRHPDI